MRRWNLEFCAFRGSHDCCDALSGSRSARLNLHERKALLAKERKRLGRVVGDAAAVHPAVLDLARGAAELDAEVQAAKIIRDADEYIDRKLAGLQAVQTLSRLNRKTLDKDRTYILDFQNTMEDIQEALFSWILSPAFQNPTIASTPARAAGRPETTPPNSTSSSPL